MLTNVLWELMTVVLTLSVTILKEVSLAHVTLVSPEFLLMDVLVGLLKNSYLELKNILWNLKFKIKKNKIEKVFRWHQSKFCLEK